MKQSDLKHWKWEPQNGHYVSKGDRATLQTFAHAGEQLVRVVYFANAAELTEAALIAEHYEKTKLFAYRSPSEGPDGRLHMVCEECRARDEEEHFDYSEDTLLTFDDELFCDRLVSRFPEREP